MNRHADQHDKHFELIIQSIFSKAFIVSNVAYQGRLTEDQTTWLRRVYHRLLKTELRACRKFSIF
jgi:hypothetical protein